MDHAYCNDGKTYYAKVFARKTEAEREAFRGRLECSGCGANAHFRKQSTSGSHKAHFAAHHYDHCELVEARTQGGYEQSMSKSGDARFGDLIIIRTAKPIKTPNPGRSEAQGGLNARYATTEGGTTVTKKAPTHMGPNSILTALINDPEFCQSERTIQLAGFPVLPASKFFVSLDAAELDIMQGELRGFWGKTTSIGQGPSGLWLNNGDSDGPNIWIPYALIPEAQDRFGLKNVSEQSEAMVLALGKLERSVRTKYVKIDDLNHLAIIKL